MTTSRYHQGSTDYYRPEDLTAFYLRHPDLLPKPAPAPRPLTTPADPDDENSEYYRHEWTETGLDLLRHYLDR